MAKMATTICFPIFGGCWVNFTIEILTLSRGPGLIFLGEWQNIAGMLSHSQITREMHDKLPDCMAEWEQFQSREFIRKMKVKKLRSGANLWGEHVLSAEEEVMDQCPRPPVGADSSTRVCCFSLDLHKELVSHHSCQCHQIRARPGGHRRTVQERGLSKTSRLTQGLFLPLGKMSFVIRNYISYIEKLNVT